MIGRESFAGGQKSMEYGFLSLLPPIVAVVMAIKSKNVILSLFCGGFVGTMIFAWGNLFAAVKSIIGEFFRSAYGFLQCRGDCAGDFYRWLYQAYGEVRRCPGLQQECV